VNFISKIGKSVINFISIFGEIVLLLFHVLLYFPRVFKDRKLVLAQMAIVGSNSLPLVILIGSFTGAIAALQATNLFEKFNLIGIATPFIGSSIATVVFTELTPVLTALVIADKNRYLAMPRIFAALVMMPILAVFSNIVALVGGFFLTLLKFGFTFETFFSSIQNYFSTGDVMIGLFKSFVFGGVTALIGVYVGFKTEGGAEGVGSSTVRAFTLAAASILILDAIFGTIL